MKYAFAILIILHALLHLLGFVKEFRLAPLSQMSGETLISLTSPARRVAGAMWLVSCLCLLVTAGQYLRGIDAWWQWALISAILSQLLIMLYWQDAKAGTVVNIILLAVAVLGYGQWNFSKMVGTNLHRVIVSRNEQPKVITEEMINRLPASVQHWLRSSGVVGKETAYNLRLKQTGKMRTALSQPWMDVEAEQYFNVEEPAFVWYVKTQMKGLPVNGRDSYMEGRGRMLITASGLIKIVDASGPEIDQGSMLRYMGEMCWFPSGALNRYITWEEIDSARAKMIMTYKGITASGICTFSADGRLLRFDAKRFMDSRKDAVERDWYAVCTEWSQVDDIIIPVKGSVKWSLPEGEFDYYHYEITALEYNISGRW